MRKKNKATVGRPVLEDEEGGKGAAGPCNVPGFSSSCFLFSSGRSDVTALTSAPPDLPVLGSFGATAGNCGPDAVTLLRSGQGTADVRYYHLVSIFHRLGQHRPNGSIASVHVQNKRSGEIRVSKYRGAHQQVLQRCEGSLLAGSPLPFLIFPCEFMEWACDTGKVLDEPPSWFFSSTFGKVNRSYRCVTWLSLPSFVSLLLSCLFSAPYLLFLSSFNNDRGSNPVEARNEPARESGTLHTQQQQNAISKYSIMICRVSNNAHFVPDFYKKEAKPLV
ncbi:hypothetical protein T4E_64 [Trichinella pseudospiralis]|uniref:Uncharacterized protein n=1 Tax=Trichinella pseudospiralis TaxID=6337 RepID=A0A0V0Y972_TRIPS|nr:hypothetical protein T4E_64 [Trichinella pseudospiralis]